MKFTTIFLMAIILSSCVSFRAWVEEPNNFNDIKAAVQQYVTLEENRFLVAPTYTITWDEYSFTSDKDQYVGIIVGSDSPNGTLVHFKCDALMIYKTISGKEKYTFQQICQPLQLLKPSQL